MSEVQEEVQEVQKVPPAQDDENQELSELIKKFYKINVEIKRKAAQLDRLRLTYDSILFSDEDDGYEHVPTSRYDEYVEQIINNYFTIEIQKPQEEPLFFIKYNSEKDAYESSDPKFNKIGWESLTYRANNLVWHQESYWKNYFVCRNETCPADRKGAVGWKFDLSQVSGWRYFKLRVMAKVELDKHIELLLKYRPEGQQSVLRVLELNTFVRLTKEDIKGCDTFKLIATLNGGRKKPLAWQKPQLFIQIGDVCDTDALILEVY